LIERLAAHYIERNIDLVLGIEARGFICGPACVPAQRWFRSRAQAAQLRRRWRA